MGYILMMRTCLNLMDYSLKNPSYLSSFNFLYRRFLIFIGGTSLLVTALCFGLYCYIYIIIRVASQVKSFL